MKAAVLARPNLKLLLLGALLLAIIEHLVGGYSQAPASVQARITHQQPGSNHYFQSLLEQAEKQPSSALYMRISAEFEQRRDFKRALRYLRWAEQLAQFEDNQ